MNRSLPLWLALLPMIVLVVCLAVIISLFGGDALSGGSQIALLVASAVCFAVARERIWSRFEEAITKNISGVATAIILLLLIGALSGTWMVSGVVPMLISYGMTVLHPSIFLVSCLLICALVSVVTGSSWTTVATLGIAMLGIGRAYGFEDGWIAGAIISGAYFGDKISPLSDTTVLASSSARVPLFEHIRYMMITTVPSFCIALVVFAIAGSVHETHGVSQVEIVSAALSSRFHITPWLLVVPVFTGVLIARRVPPIPTLFLSSLLAIVFALIFQPECLSEIGQSTATTGAHSAEHSWQDLVRGCLMTVYGATNLSATDAGVTDLISTKGMAGMLNTIWLILCAMCFGASMKAGGMLAGITQSLKRFTNTRTGLVSSTVVSGLVFNTTSADQYLSIILTTNMFRKVYENGGYENRLLSRTTEDCVTVTSVLIPWNTCGMTQAAVLGVPTMTYLPYCVFNYISPLVSITIAATGYKIFRSSPQLRL